MKLKCGDCGRVFDEEQVATWQEDRGEFWGRRVYETFQGCPFCYGVGITDVIGNEDEEGDEDAQNYD